METRGGNSARIYTRTGDRGQTGLYGGGRVPKDSPRVHAYGLVDELNALLGVAVAVGESKPGTKRLAEILLGIQQDLFVLGGDLATRLDDRPDRLPVIRATHVDELERLIDETERHLEPLKEFILPGGGHLAAQLHVCRARCRAAERACVALARDESIGEQNIPYLNRLSDLCFVLARWAAKLDGRTDVAWRPNGAGGDGS